MPQIPSRQPRKLRRTNRQFRGSQCCQSSTYSPGRNSSVVSLDQKENAMNVPASAAAATLRRGEAAQTNAASSHITPMLSRNAIRWYHSASGDSENTSSASPAKNRRRPSSRPSRYSSTQLARCSRNISSRTAVTAVAARWKPSVSLV